MYGFSLDKTRYARPAALRQQRTSRFARLTVGCKHLRNGGGCASGVDASTLSMYAGFR